MLTAPAVLLKCPFCADVFKLVQSSPPAMPAGLLRPEANYQGQCKCGACITLAGSSGATVQRILAKGLPPQ